MRYDSTSVFSLPTTVRCMQLSVLVLSRLLVLSLGLTVLIIYKVSRALAAM